MDTLFLLVGLGNPGKEYAETRHNAGFMAADSIIRRFAFSGDKEKFHSELYTGSIKGQRALLLKPTTYMNRSGQAVQAAMQFYKIPLSHVIVLHDELDLPLGKVRVKVGGGAGGHNGLKDIDNRVGKEYMRVRIGIGHPGDKDRVTGHVLSGFSGDETSRVEAVSEAISEYFPLLLEGKDSLFMSRLAGA